MRICLILALFSFVSCEQPRTGTRINTNSSKSRNGTTIIYQGSSSDTIGDSSVTPSSASTEPENKNTDNESSFGNNLVGVNSDNENCNWSEDAISNFEFSTELLGNFNLCRSSSNPNLIYFQIKTPPTNDICFIPTNEDQGGGTHYLGSAQCIVAKNSNQIFSIEMIKNRQGFYYKELSGVMIMLNANYEFNYGYPFPSVMSAPDAFFTCMNEAWKWYIQNGTNNPYYCNKFSEKNIHSYFKF